MVAMIRAHIIYSGRVQGVGFRFTVQRSALKLKLVGWVKNLPNGSVEVMIEGVKESIEQLCKSIEGQFEDYIQNKDIQYTPAQSDFKEFQIAY